MSGKESQCVADSEADRLKMQDIAQAIHDIDDKIRRLEIALNLRADESE